ncbi:hypothetical protein HSX11_29425 [Oxalobacteraceae bacterium]|nr:hypothetical protein [Oxalobacteraceae bacterium]
MPQSQLTENIYEGTLDIGGIIDTKLIYISFFNEQSSVVIRDGAPSIPGCTRKELCLSPLTVGMLRAQDSQTMAEGIRYAMEGTHLGVASRGPLGHPGMGNTTCMSSAVSNCCRNSLSRK